MEKRAQVHTYRLGGATRGAVRFLLRLFGAPLIVVSVLAFVGVIPDDGTSVFAWLGFAALGVVLFALSALVKDNRLRVGSEGIVIIRGAKTRFVPHSKITDVLVRPHPELPKDRFAKLVIRFLVEEGVEDAIELDEVESVHDVCDAIRAAKAAYDARPSTSLPRVLAEEPTSLAAVEAEARRGGFRSEPITPELLASIASDPRTAPKVRVAAAAVAVRIDPAIAPRVNEAADETAQEELASALHDAARGRARLDRL